MFRNKSSFSLVLLIVLALSTPVLTPRYASAQVTDQDIRNLNTDTENGQENNDMNPWALMAQMLLALGLVLLIMFGVVLLFRRMVSGKNITGGNRGDAIRIVSTKMLGARRSLVLVRVRGQTLLLGLTPQRINCLTEIHELDGEWIQPPETEAQGESRGRQKSFERHLGRFVNQQVGDEDSTEE